MYLRTPKRYTRGQKRSPISLRWLWLWILTPLVAFAGLEIYNRRDQIAPPVHQAIYNLIDSAGNSLATAAAPTPLPTQDPSDRLARANADWREGRIEAAVNDYQAIADSLPNNVEVHYRITLGLLMEGQLQQALAAAENTLTADPFSSDAWAIRAMTLDWNGRYGEAIASALRALELNPDNARAMAFLAEAYKDNGNFDLAQETINRALELDPDSFEALRVAGLIALEVNFDIATAGDYFQQAYDLAPNLPYLGIDLARIQINSQGQDWDSAIALVSDIVELNPQNAAALFELGSYWYSGKGNFTQAAEYLNRCVQANPASINCNALLGRVQLSLEQYPQAAESLQKAIDLGTTSARHYLWAGRAQIALGNCPAAVPLLERSRVRARELAQDDVFAAAEENLRECQIVIPGDQPEATDQAQA